MSRFSPSGQLPLPRNSVLGKPSPPKGVEDNAFRDSVSPRNSGSHVEKRTVQQTTRHDEVAKGRGTDGKRDIRDPKRFDLKRPGQSVPKSALDKLLTPKFNVPRWANSATATAPKYTYNVLGIPFNASDEEIGDAWESLTRMWSVEEIKIWGPASGLSEDVLLKRRDHVLQRASSAHSYLLDEEMEDFLEPKKLYNHYDGFEPSNDCCVPDSDGVPCRLSIICKTHSLEAKRAAAGGRLEFDRRLRESEREINDLLLRVQDFGEREDLEEHLSEIRIMMAHEDEKPSMYIHYTISEDRCGDQDAVTSNRLAALGSKNDGPRFKHASLALLGKRSGMG